MEREFKLGDHLAHPATSELEGPEGRVAVEAKSMAVLEDLARHAGEVRTRKDLLFAVWGDAFVSEEVLSHAIWDLRRALGDHARQPRFIQTVPRRGYRLIAPVSWLAAGPGESTRYRRTEQLGAGSMGIIWKAEDTLLHRTVALKFLPAEWSRDPQARERLLREARIAARLDHPNICTLHEVCETSEGRLFLVLAYYGGGTLKERLDRSPLPWPTAVAITAAVSRGLRMAHAQGVIHRDIKPANLIFPEDASSADEPKILDFGIARFVDETHLTLTGRSSAGTPAYKSPEQTLGRRVTQRTDLWSLGVVLYEMLAGRRPFRGDYEQAVVHAILNREPEPLATGAPEIPAALATIVERLLDKDPDRRYPTAEALLADLEAVSRQSPVAAPPSAEKEVDGGAETRPPAPRTAPIRTPVDPKTAPSRPRRWILRTAALLAVLALAFLRFGPADRPDLVVVVAPPEVYSSEDHGDAALAASGLLVASLNALAELEGLAVLDPSEIGDVPGSATAAARAAAAHEVLKATLEHRGPLAQVTLRRIRGEDARVLWSDAFESRIHPEAARLRADLVGERLRRAYPEHPVRSGVAELGVQAEDYRRYLEIRHRHADLGEVVRAEDVAALDDLLESSPRFLEGYLALAEWAAVEIRDSRQIDELDVYLRRLAQAEELVPDDPRPLIGRFRLESAGGRWDAAAHTLGRLRPRIRGEVRWLELEAELFEGRGELDRALESRRQAVELRPSWRALFRLASLEYRRGQVEDARAHLEALLELVPESRPGLSKLGELELLYGDLGTSAEIYARLARRHGQRNHWSNLGTAHYLGGDYRSAAASYREALLRAPAHPAALVNLADAEAAQGDDTAARERCREVVERLSAHRARGELGAIDRMIEARCQARLGELRRAVEITQSTLQDHPRNAEVTYQAAAVYALAGERTSALVNVEQALGLGVQTRWFRLPEFAALAKDPGFEALLSASAPQG